MAISWHICDRNDKLAKQCYSELREEWIVVDPLLLIHLNSWTNEGLIEQCYYLPRKQLLPEKKDKEFYELEAHIQVSTIKAKLIGNKENLHRPGLVFTLNKAALVKILKEEIENEPESMYHLDS